MKNNMQADEDRKDETAPLVNKGVDKDAQGTFTYLTMDESNEAASGIFQDLQKKKNISRIVYWLTQDLFFIETLSEKYPNIVFIKYFNAFSDGFMDSLRRFWTPLMLGLLATDLVLYFSSPFKTNDMTAGDILLGKGKYQYSNSGSLGAYLPTEFEYWFYPSVLLANMTLNGLIDMYLFVAKKIENSSSYKNWCEHPFDYSMGEAIVCILNTLLVVAAEIKFIALFVFKISNAMDYLNRKNQCQDTFAYMPNSGDFECAVCPEWNFVAPKDVFSVERCLNGLLERVSDPEEVLKKLDELMLDQAITAIDFSSFQWSKWSTIQFKQLVIKLTRHIDYLELLNLSDKFKDVSDESEKIFIVLKTFMHQVHVDHLIVNDRMIDDLLASELIEALIESKTKHFQAINAFNSNSAIRKFSQWLNHTMLSVLDLRRNNIASIEYSYLSDNLPPSMKSIDMRDNPDNGDGLLSLVRASAKLLMDEIRVGGCDLSLANFTEIGSEFAKSSVKVFELSNANIDDILFTAFMKEALNNQNTIEFNMANNRISKEGVCYFLENCHKNLLSFILNGNPIGNEGVSCFAEMLNTTNITNLSLSNVNANGEFFYQIFYYLLQSKNYQFDFSDNNIYEEIIEKIASWFLTHPNIVSSINLSKNKISSPLGKKLLEALGHSDMDSVDLSKNFLDDYTMTAFDFYKENAKCLNLYLEDNFITAKGVMKYLSNTKRFFSQQVNFDKNRIGSDNVGDIVVHLTDTLLSGDELSHDLLPQLQAVSYKDSSLTTTLSQIHLHGFFNQAAQNALERTPRHISAQYESNRDIYSSSNVAESIYLGNHSATFVVPSAIAMIALYTALRLIYVLALECGAKSKCSSIEHSTLKTFFRR